MKKLLLAAAVSTVASSALASENMFYVRGDVGGAAMHRQNLKQDGHKLRNSNHVYLSAGVGSYLMDNVRTELALAHHFHLHQKTKVDGNAAEGDNTANINYRASSLMVRGLVDVVDMGYGSVFGGAGVGISRVGATDEGVTQAQENDNNGVRESKNGYRFAWQLLAGVGIEAAEGVNVDLTYSYNDYGSLKTKLRDTKLSLKSHNIGVGFRINL